MADNKAKIELDGDVAPFRRKLQEAGNDLKKFGEDGKRSLSSLAAPLDVISDKFLGLGALFSVGGMAVFVKSMIDAEDELGKLSQKLGISVEQLAGYKLAAETSNLSTEEFAKGVERLSKYVETHRAAMAGLGVTSKTAEGQLKQLADVFAVLPDGPQKTALAMTVMGRSGAEMIPLLNKGSEALQAMIERGQELNPVTKENAAQAEFFNDKLTEEKIALEGVATQIGNKLMPWLVAMTQAWADNARNLGLFNGTLATLGSMGTIGKSIALVWSGVAYAFERATLWIGASGAAWSAFAHGNFKLAGAIGEEWKAAGTRARAEYLAQRSEIMNAPPLKIPVVPTISDKGVAGKPSAALLKAVQDILNPASAGAAKAPSSMMPAFEAQLAEMKVAAQEQARAEGTFRQMSLADELAFWQQKLALVKGNARDELAVRQKVAAASLALLKQQFDAHIAQEQTALDAWQHNQDKRLEIARTIADEIKAKYGEESAEYQREAQKIVQIERQKQEQLKQLADLRLTGVHDTEMARIEQEESLAKFELDSGQINQKKYLAMLADFNQQRLAAEVALIQAKIDADKADPDSDPIELERLQQQLLEIRRNYAAKGLEIEHQTVLQSQKIWTQLGDAMSSVWDKAVTAIMQGTFTWRSALQALFAELAGVFGNVVKGMVGEWIKGHSQQLAASLGFSAQQKAIQATASAQTVAVKAGETEAVVASNAAQAGSGAAASQAAIPISGPMLALAAMAAIFAAVMALGSRTKSAAKGYDIPAGINPMVQTHEEEMVLPAHLANMFRELAANGAGQGAGTRVVNVLDPELAAGYMKSAAGERVILNHIRANSGAVRQMLR